jgi:hypothetical protein
VTLELVAIAVAVVAAIAVLVVGRGLDGAISHDIVALLVLSSGLAASPMTWWISLPIAAVALGTALMLLVRRKKRRHTMRPLRSTAIFACGLGVALLLLVQGVNAHETRRIFRTHVEPGGEFGGGRLSASFGGPRRDGSRCIVDVWTLAGFHHVPTSTLGDGCNGVAVTVFPSAFVVQDDDGTTTTYALPSALPMRGPMGVRPSLEWLTFAGLVLAALGMISLVRRARVRDAGPYRAAAIDVESVADFGVPPAASAALACMAPIAVALLAKLLSD